MSSRPSVKDRSWLFEKLFYKRAENNGEIAMSTSNHTSIARVDNSPNTISWRFVAEWNVPSRNRIYLFQGPNGFAFSRDSRDGTKELFSTVFDPYYALNIINMFKRTIAANLADNTLHSSSFLPVLFSDAEVTPKVHVALFGRVLPAEKETNLDSIITMRWGIFYSSTREEQVIESKDPISQELIRQTAKGMTDLYGKRFSLVIECDQRQRVNKIALKYQRSWYETSGKSCTSALVEYLSHTDETSLTTLKQLGLAPEQVAVLCTDAEWGYFRDLLSQLNNLPQKYQEKIFANLEKLYPAVFSVLLRELLNQRKQPTFQSEYSSILAKLQELVIGQEKATGYLATALNAQRNNNERATFLFVGPKGIGKTELAKAAGELKGNRFVTFEMDQFKGSVDFYKLFGAPPGHVGSSDKPLFAKEMDRYSSSPKNISPDLIERTVQNVVILFDELEKAHVEVKQSLLTLFQEGYCKVQYTSGNDRTNLFIKYVFERCIFVGTSNLYKDKILEDFRRQVSHEDIANHFVRLNEQDPQRDSYSPELLNRMTVVAFGPIPKGEVYRNLVKSKLPSLLASLQNSVNCLGISIAENNVEAVINILETKLYGDGTGLRNLKQYFDQEIRTVIFKQETWGELKDKQISIVPYTTDRLALKCVTKIYGRTVEEYPLISL